MRVRNRRDEQAWSEFLKYYGGYIYNIARRMNLNHHDAQEIGQTVGVKLWDKLPEFEHDSNKGRFRGWLCTVAGNEVKRLLIKNKRRMQSSDELDVNDAEFAVASEIEKMAEEEWRLYVAHLAWERIRNVFPDKTRKAFELVSQGVEVEKIARQLDIAESPNIDERESETHLERCVSDSFHDRHLSFYCRRSSVRQCF